MSDDHWATAKSVQAPFYGALPFSPITEIDLARFHQQHFPHLPLPSIFAASPAEQDEDDGLGYYPDGVKRTITDDQIAIFRHSEIQALLKERRDRESQSPSLQDELTVSVERRLSQSTTSQHKRKRSTNTPVQYERRNISSVEGSPVPVEAITICAEKPPSPARPNTSSDEHYSPPWAYRGISDGASKRRKKRTKKKLGKASHQENGCQEEDEHARKSREGEYSNRRVARALDDVGESNIDLEY